jgi:signal transduction histidine kinase
MPAIASLRRNRVELAWGLFALANLTAMRAWPTWETIPFHFIWVSLTLLYGFRVWRPRATTLVLAAVAGSTGGLIAAEASQGNPMWGELLEVPLMSAMFLAMVWHARRRQAALDSQRFLADASHELRTPVTIARGHLELAKATGRRLPEVTVALDELGRMQRIIERLLLLARAERPAPAPTAEIEITSFLEDVFVAWSEAAPRAWRLGPVAAGTLRAAPDRLRVALDALLENAVQHTQPGDLVAVRARADDHTLVIEVEDSGPGIPADAVDHIFDRFARADHARGRDGGGTGLGLAIVAAVAEAHHGRCSVASSDAGSTFSLTLPHFQPTRVRATTTGSTAATRPPEQTVLVNAGRQASAAARGRPQRPARDAAGRAAGALAHRGSARSSGG